MSKMTDEQIIKGLEKTLALTIHLLGDDANKKVLVTVADIKNTLDLINRYKTENEKLNIELKAMRGAANSYKSEVERLQKENEELGKAIAGAYELNCFLEASRKCVRNEAIKEFADRLKEHLKGNGGLFCVTTMNAQIDNLVKEMVGEGK